MSFLRALRAYIGLGPDEDIEDRYLYELNSRRRELDLDEIEAQEIHLEQPPDPVGLELESDDVVIVTPGGRTQTPRGGSRPSRSNGRTAAGDGRRAIREDASSFDASEFGDSPFSDDAYGGGGSTGERSGRARSGRGPGPGELNVVGGADGTAVDNGHGVDDEFDAGGLLDFLEDETYRDEPVDTGVRTRARKPRDARGEAVVRSLDSMRAKPRTIIPESFGDAKLVADEFKRDIPVVLNLQSLDRDLARRLIDFASGICYAMDGSMEKIASQVFLLIPESVEVSAEDRRRIEERGYAR